MIRDRLIQPSNHLYAQCRQSAAPAQAGLLHPGRNYPLTWQSGFAGVGYDREQGAGS